MAAITLTEIAAAYEAGRKRLDDTLTEADAIRVLTGKFGMKRSSADGYLGALRHMVAGTVFKRTINALAADYYLDRLEKEVGGEVAQRALKALNLHIAYYEGTSGVTCHKLRKVADTFAKRLSDGITLDAIELSFRQAVEASKTLSDTDRQKLLPKAGHKPPTTVVKITTYIRSPHVVAAVLAKADGICARCGERAPFARKSDGTPYLEVHHRVRLADNGEDTVSNAEALCPNCHRWRHYGE
jgi:5-methylcytosine-specific restriction protein A